jgi:hypothetical protein
MEPLFKTLANFGRSANSELISTWLESVYKQDGSGVVSGTAAAFKTVIA